MLVNTKADMVMLGLLSHPEIAGTYKVALSFAGVVGLSLTSGNLYLSPRVSALHETGMKNELQSLLNKFSTWTFFIALVASIIFLLVGEYTLEMLFGGDYSNSYRVLCILIIGQLINAFFGPVGMVLSMTGNQGFAARIAGVAAAINVLMNLIMIPKFGGEGAAISTAITLFIWNSLMYRFVTKKLNLDPSIIWRLKPEALRLCSK
jgi:O-antigen/teichoic acid export membrane protein